MNPVCITLMAMNQDFINKNGSKPTSVVVSPRVLNMLSEEIGMKVEPGAKLFGMTLEVKETSAFEYLLLIQ